MPAHRANRALHHPGHAMPLVVDSLARRIGRYLGSRAYAWRLYDEARADLRAAHALSRTLAAHLAVCSELLSRKAERRDAPTARTAFITLPPGATPADYAPYLNADFTPSAIIMEAVEAMGSDHD